MKKLSLIFGILFSFQAWAAAPTEKSTQALSQSVGFSKTDASAVFSTNMADFTKNRANVSVDVMMNRTTAATLSFASHSEEEVREKVANRPKLTVDRTQFGIGANFYWKPLTAIYNLAVAPSLIFQSEKDAVNAESNTGFGLKAMGIFKPLPRLMAQGGVSSNVVGSKTTTDILIGIGLLF